MKVERTAIIKNLPKKGFRKEQSGHHIYFHHEYRGMKTGAYTYVSRSTKHKDVSGSLLPSMKKQLRLQTTRDVVDLVNCPMSGEEYNRILIGGDTVDPDETTSTK